MKIWIYYHIAQFPGWEQMVDEKIALMKQHGLWQAADKIVLQLHYDPDAALRWMLKHQEICRDPRITVLRHIEVFGIIGIFPTQKPVGEVYSIRELHDQSLKTHENTAVFRYHTKGITHWDKPTWPAAKEWNRYYDYWTIEKWQLCYETLKAGYDTVGANWHHGHWSGNIWWATTDWMNTIPQLKWPHEVNFERQLAGFTPRHDAEHWIGYTGPRKLELDHFEHAVDCRWQPNWDQYALKKDLDIDNEL
jgi:hypothetical protein